MTQDTQGPDQNTTNGLPKVSLLEQVTPLARQLNCLDIDRIRFLLRAR
jgi:hypothetical protein